ncbi:MAG: SpoVA/SpoVAEb family sporulation membrane protein [Clostridia bacterium]|nr:SpoVA/SpoVAEb family sporulation membrane protein [Clostridia bacterium]
MPEKDKEYDRMTKKASPPSPKLKNSVLAFLFGGTICTLGELFGFIYGKIGIDEKTTAMLIPVTLIVIAAALTGIGVFDKIAKHAGAGTLVPITGFANAVVSSGLEYTTDGKIYGTGAKMFTIAGPVIVYGCGAASVFGLIYYCFM